MYGRASLGMGQEQGLHRQVGYWAASGNARNAVKHESLCMSHDGQEPSGIVTLMVCPPADK